LKEDAANKSTDITLSDATNTRFPTELAVRTYVNASAAEGSGALSEEVARATAAEEKLATDLEAETIRATSAEDKLNADLTAETTRAIAAETTLTTNLLAETARATSAEGVLQDNIETVQDNVDANKTAAETAIALKEDSANKSTDITLSDATNTKFPTELAVRTFVNASAAE
ncbi:hypothetical protein, partial [Lunatibacter salilacus]|uniref:hypothetical protein n=1 Tax=Lunatibacter salilacus TaxID=2483804 RepID=UPI0018FE6AD8